MIKMFKKLAITCWKMRAMSREGKWEAEVTPKLRPRKNAWIRIPASSIIDAIFWSLTYALCTIDSSADPKFENPCSKYAEKSWLSITTLPRSSPRSYFLLTILHISSWVSHLEQLMNLFKPPLVKGLRNHGTISRMPVVRQLILQNWNAQKRSKLKKDNRQSLTVPGGNQKEDIFSLQTEDESLPAMLDKERNYLRINALLKYAVPKLISSDPPHIVKAQGNVPESPRHGLSRMASASGRRCTKPAAKMTPPAKVEA